jgi:sugar lactone lactonase YvrE
MVPHFYALCRRGLFLFACLILLPLDVVAWDRGVVERFATLEAGSPNPEGITVDRNGDVYVTGFNPLGTGPGKLFVFDNDGRLLRSLDVAGSSPALLGLAFHPTNRALLVIDFGAGNVLSVNPLTGASSVFSAIPGGGLNALTFDRSGNVYIADSFRGKIWRTGRNGGAAEEWASDPLLTASGFPPFGANGLDFNNRQTALFVANTANDTIVRIPVMTGGSAGKAEVFTNSINGADGLFVDEQDNVWVCANQSDEIVVLDKTGKAISKLGDFNGVRDGSPVGLLFPASLARDGDWIYITNLSLDLRPITGQQSVDSQWSAQVQKHTIARIRAHILGF